MKSNKENIVERYYDGLTNIKEERLLFESSSTPELEAWSKYVTSYGIDETQDLSTRLWRYNKLKSETNASVVKIIWRTLAVAASITLLIAISNPQLSPKKQSLAEKKALLEEARQMFEQAESTKYKSVLYEDEAIIFYVTN